MKNNGARREAVRRMREDIVFEYVRSNGAGFSHKRRLGPGQQPLGQMRWPVAVLPDALYQRMGAKSRVVTVSVAHAAKIIEKHPEIDETFWPKLQDMLDRPGVVTGTQKIIIWKGMDCSAIKAIIKLTSDGELFLNSA